MPVDRFDFEYSVQLHTINMCGPSGTLSVASKFVVLTVLIGITLFMTLISTIVLASHLDGHPTNTSKIIIFLFWFGYYLMYF